MSWGMGVGWLLRSGFLVCVSASRLPVSRAPVRGGADGGWLAAVVAWRLHGWSRLLGSAWVAWPGVGVRACCVVDVGASGDAPGGDGVGDADGVIGDGAGAGGACGSGGRCRWCSGWRRNW